MPPPSRRGIRPSGFSLAPAAPCPRDHTDRERLWWRVPLIAVRTAVITGTFLAELVLSACTGGYYVPSFTAPTPRLPKPQLVRVTIDDSGVNPAIVSGPRVIVEFINQDTTVHDIRSDPHPGHIHCAELNLGVIQPGHTVSILKPFESGRTCGYHDETQPDDLRFQGSISIR